MGYSLVGVVYHRPFRMDLFKGYRWSWKQNVAIGAARCNEFPFRNDRLHPNGADRLETIAMGYLSVKRTLNARKFVSSGTKQIKC